MFKVLPVQSWYSQWWARAMNSSLFAIFFTNKGLIVIGTFFFNGAPIFSSLGSIQQGSLVFKCQRDFHFFPENQHCKNKK